MKTLLLSFAICLLVNLSGYSQTIEWQMPVKDTVYEAKYNKLKALYIKKIRSDSYKKFSEINKAFMDKVNFKDHFKEIQMPTMLEWIKANLDKTKFASYEEAEKEWAVVMSAASATTAENKEYQDAVRELLKNGDSEIVRDVMQDVGFENHDGQ